MNNILVSKDNIFNLEEEIHTFKSDNKIVLDITNIKKEYKITILENVKVELILTGKNANISFKILLNKNSNLVIQSFIIDGNINIDANLLKESNFTLNNSLLNNCDSNNNIKVTHLEDESVSNIKNHGFSTSGKRIVFDVEGKINKDASKCICHQDNQIIENKNSTSTILPKLYIDNYDVEATHSAYVGEFKEDELFFLESRGISEEDSKLLLLDAFLIGYLDLDNNCKSKLKDIILNYFNKEV